MRGILKLKGQMIYQITMVMINSNISITAIKDVT